MFGDAILDRWWHGPSHRLSREAPVPVVEVTDRVEEPGGAANAGRSPSVVLFSGGGATQIEVTGLYWHFVDVIWVFLYPLLYLIKVQRP